MKSRTFLTALLVAAFLAVALVGVAWASSSGGAARKATAPRDALTAARFSITIDGYEIASFTELAGISSGIDAVEVDASAQLIPPMRGSRARSSCTTPTASRSPVTTSSTPGRRSSSSAR